MHATTKQLNFNVKGTLEFCEYCDMGKINHKFLHKVAEERNLKPGEFIYLDIISCIKYMITNKYYSGEPVTNKYSAEEQLGN